MRDVIVIGASAGGVHAVAALLEQFPADFPGVVLVVLHLPAMSISVLPQILSRRAKLPARSPRGDESLSSGQVYVARPDHHLVVEDAKVRSVRGPRVNGHRPAIDRLFRSAAQARGDRVIGVVLTGMLDDGVGGLLEIRSRGGIAVVQQPEDAVHPALPLNAIRGAGADHIVALAGMGELLRRLIVEPGPGGDETPPRRGGPPASGA